MTIVRPFLMFQNSNAEEAMRFYVSIFPNSEINSIDRYSKGQAGPEGTVMKAVFTVAGQQVMCTDSPIKHQFDFTPSFSLFVECASEEQIERTCSSLLANGGQELMPLGSYGFSRKFAWVSDRFGVSWQLNLQ